MKKYTLLTIILIPLILMLLTGSAIALEREADWVTAETEHFIIDAPRRADIGEIGRIAETIYLGMASRYGQTDTQKTHLYVYNGRAAFMKESPSPDAAGYASPGRNIIAILQGAGNSTITLTHEINHIIFMRNVPNIYTVPQWFTEGLAIYESQPGVEAAELQKYALARDIPDFVERGTNTNDAPATRREYADGYLKINFIIDKFGREKLYEIIGRLKAGASFDQALSESLGESEDGLNAAWTDYAGGERVSIWIMQLRDIGWYIMSGLLVIAVFVFPIQKYRCLRAMRDDEDEDDISE